MMREVYSSRVDRIGYEDGVLVVVWKGGKTSSYRGVPPQLAEQVMNAPSIGQALNQSIIETYDHGYMEEAP